MGSETWGSPIRDADLDEVVALSMARFPGRPESMLRLPYIDPAVQVLHSQTVRRGGELVAFARLTRRDGMPPANRWSMVVVAEPHEGRGIGGRLLRELLTDVDPTAERLRSVVGDDDERSLAVAEHWGYAAYEHGICSRLDFHDLPEPREIEGVTFEWSPELHVEDPDALLAMLDVAETNPERASGLFLTPETLRSFITPVETAVAWVARADGRPIGLGHGAVDGEDFGITYLCVDPAQRGRGVALALKERLHASAAALGATHLFTTNEEANTQIRTLNAKLGYQRIFGDYRISRPVDSPAG
jgi:GNAT superfamily N-acetyltransferase